MWVNRDGDAFRVVDVTPGGGADDAGIRAGERIVACDGKPSTELSLPALRELFRHQPPGTVFELTVNSQSGQRTVRLTLKDLLAQ
jgi:C-terminal processing protease CtpA/Prc